MPRTDRSPYRASAPATQQPRRAPLPEADVVIPLMLLAPAFLAVVVRTIIRGEAFGTEPTVCAGFVVLAPVALFAAWRARGQH